MRILTVALFTRAWIEISAQIKIRSESQVALFTRAWIEIERYLVHVVVPQGRPLHEGVD